MSIRSEDLQGPFMCAITAIARPDAEDSEDDIADLEYLINQKKKG